MEGTILRRLCDFLPYIKKKEGIVASNWPRQISFKSSQIMMHAGFEGCWAVTINPAVFRDDMYHLGMLWKQ